MAAAAVASSNNNTHRSAIVRSNGRIVPLRCASSRVRVSVNPAHVVNPARGQGGREAEQRYHRSRDEEKPSTVVVRRRRRDENARDASPDNRKRRRESVSDYYRDVKSGSSSACRRDRDYDAYYYNRAVKRQESDDREDATRKNVSSGGSSRPEQRARTTTGPRGAVIDTREPTLEKVETAGENEAEVKRRLDIQQQREQARREMDQMVKTVEFNDPFISPLDVFKPLLPTDV
ncbi:hypothetical protein QOZ80_7BG0605850 [Eleusine coracana subsp. coracana]|nr:hypothetical protein QOZ80_7BG0605850 [Eleusine coracana subsp. coracana]